LLEFGWVHEDPGVHRGTRRQVQRPMRQTGHVRDKRSRGCDQHHLLEPPGGGEGVGVVLVAVDRLRFAITGHHRLSEKQIRSARQEGIRLGGRPHFPAGSPRDVVQEPGQLDQPCRESAGTCTRAP
jgi:hypothetical protein